MLKILFIFFSALLLIYLVLPGPTGIENFPNLPKSLKSDLPGDTVQISNVAGYFSNDYYRPATLSYYEDSYKKLTTLPFKPMRLNYPPEFAFTAIKDQTYSTYLEEFVYPMRDSLFVNGLEPFYESGQPKYLGAIKFIEKGQEYETKSTIRFYPSPLWARLMVWLGVVLSLFLTYKLGRRIIFND